MRARAESTATTRSVDIVLTVEGLRIVLDPSGVDIDDEVSLQIHRRRGARPRRRVGLRQDDGGDEPARRTSAAAPRSPAGTWRSTARTCWRQDAAALRRRLRGGLISYVPQDSSAALNPALRIGTQLMEILEVHGFGTSQADREARLRQMIEEVLLPRDKRVPAPLPAPALRRPAAARRHRHGVRLPAQGHRPRRADHRARRDHAGARARHDPRPHQAPTA